MQNAGIYHVAAQQYFAQPYSITICVPMGSAPGPRWAVPPDPHFLALRAHLPFYSLSDEQKLPFKIQRDLLTIILI